MKVKTHEKKVWRTMDQNKRWLGWKLYMNIKFNSGDDLPLNKTLGIRNMTIAIRSVFHEGSKYYPPFLLDQCLYKLKILEHDRIDMLERVDVNKTDGSHCMRNNIFVKTLNVNIIFFWFSAIDGNIIFSVKRKLKKISYFL